MLGRSTAELVHLAVLPHDRAAAVQQLVIVHEQMPRPCQVSAEAVVRLHARLHAARRPLHVRDEMVHAVGGARSVPRRPVAVGRLVEGRRVQHSRGGHLPWTVRRVFELRQVHLGAEERVVAFVVLVIDLVRGVAAGVPPVRPRRPVHAGARVGQQHRAPCPQRYR